MCESPHNVHTTSTSTRVDVDVDVRMAYLSQKTGNVHNVHMWMWTWGFPCIHAGLGHVHTSTPYGGTSRCGRPPQEGRSNK